MMRDDQRRDARQEVVRVVATTGRDASLISTRLVEAGFDVDVSPSVSNLCGRYRSHGAGALLLAVESVDVAGASELTWMLMDQPVWSDVPVLLLALPGQQPAEALASLGRRLSENRSVTVLNRPLKATLLASAVRLALEARKRQYEVRDLLSALELTNDTLEHRVEERTRELAERTEELQNFAYVASHDLREPLRKITTFGSLLQEDAADRLGDESRFFIRRMRSAATRMTGLLDDLLTYSRVVTDARPFAYVRLEGIIEDVIEHHILALREADADLHVDASVSLEADRSQVRQLVEHLLSNAIKFRRRDVPLKIRVHARIEQVAAGDEEKERCVLTIEDNGLGFDPQYAAQIFQPFERLHGRDSYHGNGMGLAIARRIVQRHHGSIHAAGTPGEGSRFTVHLPARQPIAAQDDDPAVRR